jgi:hypothetical protein
LDFSVYWCVYIHVTYSSNVHRKFHSRVYGSPNCSQRFITWSFGIFKPFFLPYHQFSFFEWWRSFGPIIWRLHLLFAIMCPTSMTLILWKHKKKLVHQEYRGRKKGLKIPNDQVMNLCEQLGLNGHITLFLDYRNNYNIGHFIREYHLSCLFQMISLWKHKKNLYTKDTALKNDWKLSPNFITARQTTIFQTIGNSCFWLIDI